MKPNNYLSLLFSIFLFSSFSQSFLNGSFETNTAPSGCLVNLLNTQFNNYMPNSLGFGNGDELDILEAGCYVPTIPHGNFAVGVADNYDEMSLQLSSPLIVGITYTISFWIYAQVEFRPVGKMEVGISNSNNTFGTSVGIVTPLPAQWKNVSVTFTPTFNASFITVRNEHDNIIHWNLIDNFSIVNSLAVDLVAFQVNAINNRSVELTWTTSTESNSDYFTLEKSADGVAWNVFDTIQAAGHSIKEIDYQAFDNNPFRGMTYFRLRQTDFDGSSRVFPIKFIYLDNGSDAITAYPNPTNDKVCLVGESIQLHEIQLFDVYGNAVTNKVEMYVNNRQLECDMQHLKAGVYIIQVGEERLTIIKK